jgi:hypothetical protein
MTHDITFSRLVRTPSGIAMAAKCSCGWARTAVDILSDDALNARRVGSATRAVRRYLTDGHDVSDLHRTSRKRAAQ